MSYELQRRVVISREDLLYSSTSNSQELLSYNIKWKGAGSRYIPNFSALAMPEEQEYSRLTWELEQHAIRFIQYDTFQQLASLDTL